MSLPNHRQVAIAHGGTTAMVDEGLADLLLALWRLGMVTEFSCQNFGTRRRQMATLQSGLEEGHTHYGYIAFAHFEHAVRFVRESRQVFLAHMLEPGLLALESSGERAFVDFPAYKLLALTGLWCGKAQANVSRETLHPGITRVQDRHA